MTDSVYFSCSSANKQMRFHVNGIERASRLDMQTSFNNKHIRKLDTLIAAERSKILDLIRYIQSNCQAFSNFVDSVCVGKFCLLMSSRNSCTRV